VSVAREMIVDLLARGHVVRFRAAGDSMHPIIRGDDYLLVEPADRTHIRRGDVVLTLADRGLTAHRVVAFADGTLITRGDNLHEDDLPVDLSRLLGRVTHAERDGRMRRIRRASSVLLRIFRVSSRAAKTAKDLVRQGILGRLRGSG